MQQSKERLEVLEKIKKFEELGKFNDDVEIDAPAKPIKPNEVDYTIKKLRSKIATSIANRLGTMYFESMIKKQKFIIKEIIGLENFKEVSGGVILTCNHFNLRDNYAIYRAIKPALKKHQYLFKVIKESNYTNFKGVVRLMMRHCNTLPLSSDFQTTKKFYQSIEELLKRGEKILIYPEQSMWWNYKKPRPLKKGAFSLAVKNNAPIVPCFITMKDSKILDDDGFFVQEYTIHIFPAIYPNKSLSEKEQIEKLMEQNYTLWKDCYEKTYNTKLEYNTIKS